MGAKFKVGDLVKVVEGGSGAHPERDIDKEVKIIEIGLYRDGAGYKVDPPVGNTLSGEYKGFIGEKSFQLLHSNLKNTTFKENKTMKYYKTKQLLDREITLCVAVEENNVRTGYSVKLSEDKENVDLGKRISLGRALNNKTNLTPDLTITEGLKQKYILASIAENVLRNIEDGNVVIKGIRKDKAKIS